MDNSKSSDTRWTAEAQSASERKDWVRAAKLWQRVLDAQGGRTSPTAFCGLAKALRQQNHLDGADAAVQRGLEDHPGQVALVREAGENALARRNWSGAIGHFRALVECENPKPSAADFAKLVKAYRYGKQPDAANDVARRGLSQFPKNKTLLREAAETASAREAWSEAAARWRELALLEGEQAPASTYIRWALSERKLGNFKAAKNLLTSAVGKYPGDVGILNEQAETQVDEYRATSAVCYDSDKVGSAAVTGDTPMSVARVCACFWSTESKLSLLSWNVNGVFPWPLVRMQLYYRITQQLELFDTPHPAVKLQSEAARRNLPESTSIENFWDQQERHYRDKVRLPADGLERPRYGILMVGRTINGVQPHTDALRKEIGDRALLLDGGLDGPPIDGAINVIALQKLFRSRYKRPEQALLPYEDRILCEKIREEFFMALGIDIGDIAAQCQHRVSDFIPLSAGFERLFAVNPISALFVTAAYNPSNGAVLEGARRNGIPVIELQHGFISPFHLGYSWPSRPDVPYSPDELWCFGDFWYESTSLPRQVRPRVIGAPYLHEFAATADGGRIENLVVFTSQGVIGRRLFEIALETARRRPDLRIIFRLHPNELLESYEEAVSKSGTVPVNFELSHRTPNIFALLASTAIQVGAFSTTLFEGMSLGSRTIVLDLPGSEYMKPAIERGDALLVHDVDELVEKLDQAPLARNPEYYYAKTAVRLVSK